MGKPFLKYLKGSKIYVCSNCFCHICSQDQLISNLFHGKYGKSYLVNKVYLVLFYFKNFILNKSVNVSAGKVEKKKMTTGIHEISIINCLNCKKYLGFFLILFFKINLFF
jgi:hypothetical protein